MRKLLLPLLMLSVVVGGGLPGSPIAEPAEAAEHCLGENPKAYVPDPTGVAVYSWNIQLMERDWAGWINFVKNSADKPVPELLLIQDIERGERDAFQCALEKAFGGVYHGRAVTNWSTEFNIQRAVIWRASRFDVIDSRTDLGWGGPKGECNKGSTNAGIIQVKLRDTAVPVGTDRYVGAASFKTPPGAPDSCAWGNTKFVNTLLTDGTWKADLMIFGTDANAPDRSPETATADYKFMCWYRGTVDGLGKGCSTEWDDSNRHFTDPIYERCNEPGRDEGTCLDNQFTKLKDTDSGIDRKRIDFMFAKRSGGGAVTTLDAQTMRMGNPDVCDVDRPGTWGQCYSDHKAIRAVLQF